MALAWTADAWAAAWAVGVRGPARSLAVLPVTAVMLMMAMLYVVVMAMVLGIIVVWVVMSAGRWVVFIMGVMWCTGR